MCRSLHRCNGSSAPAANHHSYHPSSAASQPANDMTPPPQLYPIRIDVTSNDRQLRLVDTLLWDPSCEFPSSEDDAVLDQLALEMVRDAVVIGVGRSARYFTNRLEIAETVELQQKISQQMAEQFRAMHEMVAASVTAPLQPQSLEHATKSVAAIASGEDGSHVQTNPTTRQREDETITTGAGVGEDVEERHQQDASPMQDVVATSPSGRDTMALTQEENPPKRPRIEAKAGTTITENKSDKKGKQSLSDAMKTSQNNLVSIRLRLLIHGVRIHDDFDYDPAVLSPLQLAQSIATDLNLTPEMIVSIAIEIAEQVAASNHPIVLSDGSRVVEQDEGGPQDRRNLTAAWMLPNRVHVTNVAHLVAQHRPLDLVLPSAATSTTSTTSPAAGTATGSSSKT